MVTKMFSILISLDFASSLEINIEKLSLHLYLGLK